MEERERERERPGVCVFFFVSTQRQSEWMILGRKERRIFYGKEAMCVRTKRK
jgi:hypothetical protein